LTVMTVARGRDEAAPEYGGFADWVCLDEQRVLRLDDDIEDIEAAFVEPAAIAGHAVARGQLSRGDSVIVLGAGVLGLLAMQWAKASGSSQIIVVEPRENRRALALELGADLAVTPGTELPPADIVIECAGQGESVEEAVAFARQGGRVVLVGDAASTTIAPRMWLAKEVEVVAAAGYIREDFRRAARAITDGHISVKPIYSRTIQLKDLATTLRDLAADTTDDMKVMVDPR
jgi:2-desacetyl-2-hydroxyethyl bacteriochlorophyllide A dehydrogenase